MNLMTRKQMAAQLGITYQWISVIARTDGFPPPIKKTESIEIGDDGVSIGLVSRPSWLYDFDAVSKFIREKRPLVTIASKKRAEGERSRKVPCGNCGNEFEQKLSGAHWFCSRTCKERARRERRAFTKSNRKKK